MRGDVLQEQIGDGERAEKQREQEGDDKTDEEPVARSSAFGVRG